MKGFGFDEFIPRSEQFARSGDRSAITALTSNVLDLATGLDNTVVPQSATAARS